MILKWLVHIKKGLSFLNTEKNKAFTKIIDSAFKINAALESFKCI